MSKTNQQQYVKQVSTGSKWLRHIRPFFDRRAGEYFFSFAPYKKNFIDVQNMQFFKEECSDFKERCKRLEFNPISCTFSFGMFFNTILPVLHLQKHLPETFGGKRLGGAFFAFAGSRGKTEQDKKNYSELRRGFGNSEESNFVLKYLIEKGFFIKKGYSFSPDSSTFVLDGHLQVSCNYTNQYAPSDMLIDLYNNDPQFKEELKANFRTIDDPFAKEVFEKRLKRISSNKELRIRALEEYASASSSVCVDSVGGKFPNVRLSSLCVGLPTAHNQAEQDASERVAHARHIADQNVLLSLADAYNKSIDNNVSELSFIAPEDLIDFKLSMHKLGCKTFPYDLKAGDKIKVPADSIHLERKEHTEAGALYGRFHSTFQSAVRSKDRKTLAINGEKTVEVDESECHPRILFAHVKANAPDDCYDCSMVLQDKSSKRLVLKDLFQRINNTKSPEEFGRTLSFYILSVVEKGKKEDDAIANAYRSVLSEVSIYALLDCYFEDTLGPIIDLLFGEYERISGSSLFKKESDIAAYVIESFVSKNIPIIPIHDSFITTEKHKELLVETIAKAWHHVLGDNVLLKIKIIARNDVERRLILQDNSPEIKPPAQLPTRPFPTQQTGVCDAVEGDVWSKPMSKRERQALIERQRMDLLLMESEQAIKNASIERKG